MAKKEKIVVTVRKPLRGSATHGKMHGRSGRGRQSRRLPTSAALTSIVRAVRVLIKLRLAELGVVRIPEKSMRGLTNFLKLWYDESQHGIWAKTEDEALPQEEKDESEST